MAEEIIFCDPWGADLHNIMPTGQVKTRVQAFLEKIEIAKAQQAAAGGEG
jgi:hypothetical protein